MLYVALNGSMLGGFLIALKPSGREYLSWAVLMIPFFQFSTIDLGPVVIQVWGLFVSLVVMAASGCHLIADLGRTLSSSRDLL